MGVPKFFRYISERYPCLSELVRMHQVPDFDNLYLDMNGIVHNCTHPDDSKVNQKITEEMMFLSIFRYIEYLFQVIKPRKLFFLAIDGVAPRAKMNQQRSRRFRSAKEMETRENAARQKGEVIDEQFRFDSNCITPGTEFMVRLHTALQYFIQRQISTNESWQQCQVILSGHDTPGEGEHKIMDYIRYMKSQPTYDPNTTHCLYGLDADLIMLGCSTHEAHISLLREEVKFGKNNTKSNCVENTRFFLLHLGILKEYLELEFSAVRDKVSFGYDMEKIVDDWILMSFLVGNDFVPHLPNLHIQNNALPILYSAYMDVLPDLGGYMNEDGILNLRRFQMFLDRLELEDRKLFREMNGESRYMPDDMNCFDDVDVNGGGINDDLAALVKASEEMMMDDILDGEQSEEKIFEKEFRMCRRDYYITKMHFPSDDESYETALRSEVEGYISAIQWILHYYYRGVPSWSWYYPNHYAPYISDITNFMDFRFKFDLGTPFLPFQQLLGVLPPNSKDLLPEAYQDLMLNPNSELIDFYPANFETDMNGKKQDWEALVLIPFIDEKRLLTAMDKCENKLRDRERQRNKHGPMSVYQYNGGANAGPIEGIMSLPSIPNCYSPCKSVSLQEIRVPTNRLVFGTPKGALTDVHFPGFPTMKFLKYSGRLANLRIRVFEMTSNNDTMEVTVHQPEVEKIKTVSDIHRELMDKEIFVGWPHLSHAKVVGVSDDKTYMGIHPALADHEVKKFPNYLKDIKDHHLKRMGIQLGQVKILIHVHLVKSREYTLGSNGKLVLNTDWDEVKFVYPYQTIVPNVNVYNQDFSMFKSVDEVYKKEAKVFLLSTKYYGCMGRVLDTSMLQQTKRIQITIDVHPEPNLKDVLRLHNEAKLAARGSYFNIYAACSQIGVSKHALNRVTGNFYVFSGKRRQINERAADKVNIGLQMRIPKENKEVPGISKFMDNVWYLSADAIQIICEYLDEFPKMCDVLAKPDNNIFEDDFCDDPDLTPGTYLREVAKFAETLPHQKIRPRKMGTEYIDPNVAAAVEQAAEKAKKELVFKTIKLQTKLHLLYLPRTTIKCPDPGTAFRLFDRVIVATHNLSMPIGSKGTIVSIYSETDENPLKYENKNVTTYLYEVMFDDEVPNGDAYFGDIGRSKVQTVTEQSIINITYGRSKCEREAAIAEVQPEVVLTNDKKQGRVHQQRQQQQQTNPRQNEVRQADPVVQNAVLVGGGATAEEDKRTKEMINQFWASLKGPTGPSTTQAVSQPPPVPPPTCDVDFTETLKKCLKIESGSEAPKNIVAPIQQPSPAQLPPPPANWRIEAQIQHLSKSKPSAAAPIGQNMPLPPPPPNMPPVMGHPQNHQQFPMFMGAPPRPCFQPPPMPPPIHQRGGPFPLQGGFAPNMYPMRTGFIRPVAAMPFSNPVPVPHMNNRAGPPLRYMPPRNMATGGDQFFQGRQDPEPNTLSGPQGLRNASAGHGAFIPLQAARKINKMKNLNGQKEEAKPLPVQPATKTTVLEPSSSTLSAKTSDVAPPKKAAIAKTNVKKNVAPKPARIAANFTVKE